jgi:hypothetical protein
VSRVAIGDVVEIRTPGAYAYAQVSHRHDKYGELLRILPGLFEEPLVDFGEIVAGEERFVTFFPLGAALDVLDDFRIVGREPVPEHARALPLFKMQGRIDEDGNTVNWWIWDGEREVFVGDLSDEQRDLPLLSLPSGPMLIDDIVGGWSPRDVR